MRWCAWLQVLLCISTSLLAQHPAPSAFRITGLVVNDRDGSPLRRSHVTATLVGKGRSSFREPLRTDTDETGRFLLEVPAEGNWQINVSAHSVRPQNFKEHEGYFSGVILTPAAPAYNLIFHAIPDAILTGTVTDEAGEPVRNAQVALFAINKSAQQTGAQPTQQMQGTQTDDRGRYEFASLEAGSYLVRVQARPWYAANLVQPRASVSGAIAPALDPSLDVVYPTTWYPGGSEISAAGMLTAKAGDSLQADIRLVPIASAHLIIPSEAASTGQQAANLNRPVQRSGNSELAPQPGRSPSISLVLPNGTTQPVFGQFFSKNQRGEMEIDGLAPGIYQVTEPGSSDSPPRTRTVQLGAGSTSIGLDAAQQSATVTISVDGDSRTRASQIMLRSTSTGQTFPMPDSPEMRDQSARGPSGAPDALRGRLSGPQRSPQTSSRSRAGGQLPGTLSRTRERTSSDADESVLQVPPGPYEVTLAGSSNAFLTGITARGASVLGREVNIAETPAYLAVHLGTGFATVRGAASIDGKPCVGAMVLLIPATMDDSASLTRVYRDQTNTDGSFELDRVVPGPYILVAIDHGWSVRWTDPDTLRPYLMRGTPLDLTPSSVANPKATALKP